MGYVIAALLAVLIVGGLILFLVTNATKKSNVTDAGAADTFTYAWTVTKNGNPYASGVDAVFTFSPDDDGTYIVKLKVTDDDGGFGCDTKTIDNALQRVKRKVLQHQQGRQVLD